MSRGEMKDEEILSPLLPSGCSSVFPMVGASFRYLVGRFTASGGSSPSEGPRTSGAITLVLHPPEPGLLSWLGARGYGEARTKVQTSAQVNV